MIRNLRWGWPDLLEVAPHLLGASSLAPFKLLEGEATLVSPPGWLQAYVALAVLIVAPLCFLSGRSFKPIRCRAASGAAMGYYAVMAALCGVVVAMLAASAYMRDAVWVFGAIPSVELITGPMITGGLLGLLAYVAGVCCRQRRWTRN